MNTNDMAPTLVGITPHHAEPGDPPRKAWELVLPQVDAPRLICGWVIYDPYAHPVWDHYLLEAIHLRDAAPGQLHIYLEGATHEFVLWALDPKAKPYSLGGANRYLTPANFASQFIATSDDGARQRIRQAVQDVIDGRLSPDTDFRRQWVERFNDSMMNS